MDGIPQDYTGPGLVDIQLNGYAGLDFNGDPEEWTLEAWRGIADNLKQRGVVAALPTLVTDDVDRMLARAARYAELVDADETLANRFPRLHVEGPFVSPEDGPRGAHPKQFCSTPREHPDFLERIHDASGHRVAIVSLAPEIEGTRDVIERCNELRICASIAHTQADHSTLNDAVRAGARLSSHLGNGSHQTLPRLDNYVQAQLADDRLMASFIADGHHMPFSTLKNFIRAKTPARSILITDAIAAAECGPGRYEFAGQDIEVSESGRASAPGSPNLAGSTLTLDRAVMNVAANCDLPWAEAWSMASTRPAELLDLRPPAEVTVQISDSGFQFLHV